MHADCAFSAGGRLRTRRLGFDALQVLRQGLEHFRRFVTNDVRTFGNRADQPAKHRQSAQIQVGPAIVDAHLGVPLRATPLASRNRGCESGQSAPRVTTRKVSFFIVRIPS